MNTKKLPALALLALLPAIAACTSQPTGAATPAKAAQAASSKSLPYPAAAANQTRWIISPAAIAAAAPNNTQPETIRVEIIAGKTMQVDCNTHFLTGTLKEEVLQGWGYTYWVLQSRGQVRTTMMMCPPGSAKPGFVQAEPLLVRYNSKLPVVVFVPEGMALRWRVWQAGPTQDASVR